MTTLFNIKQSDLNKLTLKDYFKTIEFALDKNNGVDRLTEFLTEQPFSETKPYLTRTQLNPIDKRFKQIELVYKDSHKVKAIVWDLKISLSQLTDIFGEPIIQNEPYSDSTVFAFRSKNENIEIIKTRHPEWLTIDGNKKTFEYTDKNKQKNKIIDPEFSFIQLDIKD